MTKTSEIIMPQAGFSADRRGFLRGARTATLSVAAVALLAGGERLIGAAEAAGAGDVDILNVALGLEHEAINAYQLGAESGLLQKPVLEIAVLFQSQHKEHRDALARTILKIGGKPVAEKPIGEYAEALQAGSLKSQADVLMLAARLERGAAAAYLGVIPSFSDPALGQVCGQLAADETMHWTVLAQALGQMLPQSAFSFGA